ncbi:MAG: hypothetical protein H7138_24475 [Myxococcales bacterium]|nr:hypothetical protein [Myxococcales bacterium]
MKKITNHEIKRRTLVLRRESIAALNVHQLRHVEAGAHVLDQPNGTFWPPCPVTGLPTNPTR